MMRLYLTRAPEGGKINGLRYVREALRVPDPAAKVAQAELLLDNLARYGYAHMATGDAVVLSRMSSLIEKAGGSASAVPEDQAKMCEAEWAGERPEAVIATLRAAAPAAFSPAAYETAMAIMAICNGDPIRSCLHAHALARTTGNDLFYEVIRCLGSIFPWIEDPLRENDFWPV